MAKRKNIFSTYEAKTQFSKLLKRVIKGEEIFIAHRNLPIAKLVAIQQPLESRKPGSAKNSFVMSDDFDAPLPIDLLSKFTNP